MSRTHKLLQLDGVRIHAVEEGQGPLVVLIHGFPESWYSWRHQMLAVAAAGYRAVAPDWRGYGLSDQPPEDEEASWDDLVADVLAILDALDVPTVSYLGRDIYILLTEPRTELRASKKNCGRFARLRRRSWWARISARSRRTSSRCSTRSAPAAWCASASPSARRP